MKSWHLVSKQQGVALISTLLIFAVIAILIAQILRQTQSTIQLTDWTINAAQAWQNALGAEELARIRLAKALSDNEVLDLLQPQPPMPTDGGVLYIEFVDLQGRINLNNIAEPDAFPGLVTRLLQQQQADAQTGDALTDWVDTDNQPTGSGGEDLRYMNMEPSYRAANHLLVDSGESLAIAGVNPDLYQRLEPLVAALPGPITVNINSAPAEVITAINPQLDGTQVVNSRENLPGGFASVEEFLQSSVTAGIELDTSIIDVSSRWYAVKIQSEHGDRQVTLYSRFQIDPESGQISLYDRVSGTPLAVNYRQPEKDEKDDDTGSVF